MVSTKLKDVLNFGFDQLTSSAIKPRIKPWVDGFSSTSHNISEVRELYMVVTENVGLIYWESAEHCSRVGGSNLIGSTEL